MMTINYIQRNQKPQIYMRLVAGTYIDITTKTGMSVDPKFWNAKTQKIRNTNNLPNAQAINQKLEKLKYFVFDKYNLDFSSGMIINSQWLTLSIMQFFDRPQTQTKQNNHHLIYFTNFNTWWIDNNTNNTTPFKRLNNKTKVLNKTIEQYQNNNSLELINITKQWLNRFVQYLLNEKQYSPATTKSVINTIKFFCRRAQELNIDVNNDYNHKITIQKIDKTIKEPYLNELEINTIFEYDFEIEYLNTTRDNFIIGLWTGLRVSDFLKCLKIENIKDGFIEIQTQKTKTPVAIPLHHHIKEILERRNGELPPKISVQKFNKNIKTICKIAGINSEMIGAVVKKVNGEKRKKIGVYKKYELISSHICRRSFCTNLFGKVPNNVIMSVAGWTNEKQMLEYVKLTHIEKAKELKKYWDKKYLQIA